MQLYNNATNENFLHKLSELLNDAKQQIKKLSTKTYSDIEKQILELIKISEDVKENIKQYVLNQKTDSDDFNKAPGLHIN